MKRLSDLFGPNSYLEVSDFILVNGQVDFNRLAYDLDCRLRMIEPYRPESNRERLEIIRGFLEAVTNAERGNL